MEKNKEKKNKTLQKRNLKIIGCTLLFALLFGAFSN